MLNMYVCIGTTLYGWLLIEQYGRNRRVLNSQHLFMWLRQQGHFVVKIGVVHPLESIDVFSILKLLKAI